MKDDHDSPLRVWRKGFKPKPLGLAQAASLFGITESHLSRIENGVSRPRDALEMRIRQITGLTHDQIAEPRDRARRMKSSESDPEREPALEAAQ